MCVTTQCPTADEYFSLACGQTPFPEAERLLTHLEGCERCSELIHLVPEADTLADLVRQAAMFEGSTPAPAVVQLIGHLSRIRPDGRLDGLAAPVAEPKEMSFTRSSPDAGPDYPPELLGWLAPPRSKGELGCLGPYRVLQILGVGGMGVVFRAHDPQLDRVVALKAMLPALASRMTARQRFLREARATAAIRHDHIVSVYQVSEDRGVPFLAMEFLEGETLDARLKLEGKLPLDCVVRIGREIALGLSAAHNRTLIHRDIKPANIWLEAGTGRAKILDFGLARTTAEECQLTLEGAIVGTPAYMSPEQAQSCPVDHRSDLFSMGCVMYQMATGEPPFRGADTISTLLAISTHSPLAPSQVESELPPALSRLIMELLAKAPADRPSSAQGVAEALEQLARPLALGSVATKSPIKSRWIAPVSVAACLLLTFLAIAWYGGSFRLVTREGTVVLEDLPADVQVLVDGAVAKVRLGPGGKWIEVQVAPGERMVLVSAPGFKAKAQDVTLSAGERKPIRIRLEPLVSESPAVAIKPSASRDVGDPWPPDAPHPAIAQFDAERAKEHQEGWAKYLNVPVEYTNSIGIVFRLIPPGEFTMGSSAEEIEAARPLLSTQYDAARPARVHSEGPQRRVVLTRPFYLGVYEVTQKQYERLCKTNPSEFSPTGVARDKLAGRDTSDSPVENVTWFDAALCCNLLSKAEQLPMAYRFTAILAFPVERAGYRLPTEAEWEFACRAGTSTLYWCGDDQESLTRACWFGANDIGNMPKAVGTRTPNPFGLYDVHGNVWEWVHDGWDPQFYQKLVGPAATNPRSDVGVEGRRVIRGGDYFMSAAECRSACRDGCEANTHWSDVGFRLALPIEAVQKLKRGKL
jgi:serine/threonine protein kinase/formylglycine-generating enzyme required for sulfatase activity